MKNWISSKTVWYNVATLLAVLVALLGQYGAVPNSGTVTTAVEINTVLSPFINILLRRLTKTAMTFM